MSFLDDAINKTKEVFDVACKKTDEVVTTQKQKFSVASLESKREKDFADLGRIYFELVKDSTDLTDEARNLVDAISEKNEEIARLNKDIQNTKNKRICPNCNANIDANSVYCNNCGTKVTIESEQE